MTEPVTIVALDEADQADETRHEPHIHLVSILAIAGANIVEIVGELKVYNRINDQKRYSAALTAAENQIAHARTVIDGYRYAIATTGPDHELTTAEFEGKTGDIKP